MTADVADAPARGSLLYDPKFRSIAVQILVVVGLVAFVWWMVDNTITNLRVRGIATGFGFLSQPAGFDIASSLIAYDATMSHGRVFFVGLLNTMLVSVLGVIFATVLGFSFGVLRLSHNWLIAKLAAVYVEGLRNVPLLLQMIFWWTMFLALPGHRQAFSLGDAVFLSKRGLNAPWPVPEDGFWLTPVAFVVAVVAVIAIGRWSRKRQETTGEQFPVFLTGLGLVIGLPLLAMAVMGFPLSWDIPSIQGFNFVGGFVVTPEFFALWFALSVYTGAFIAEIVRAGILAVSHGQTEAAFALGLRPGWTTRLIILPQALRVIIPPLTSQYLNLTKNSSLAIAIGFPDLVSVFSGTSLNQTGQAIEIVMMTMGVYLALSLGISGFMNWYNKRIALVER